MDDKIRQSRLLRIKPYLAALRKNEEPKAGNKPNLLMLMQDLKDEGNTLFKESKFQEAWEHYRFALFIARQLERTFYHSVEKEFLATLFCNAALCCLKTKNYEEALKDAENALRCQDNNIKAMYRKSVALKELGRYKDSLKQALRGKEIDTKNNFDELIEDLRILLGKTGKSKDNSSSGDSSSIASNEWLQGTNAIVSEKKKEITQKTMPPKKKRGQSQSNNNGATKPQAKANVVNKYSDSDPDSDSTVSDDDRHFAAKMQNVKSRPVVNSSPVNTATKVGVAKVEPSNSTKPAEKSNTDTDGFSGTKAKVNQQQKLPTTRITWPLENFDFRLACRMCYVKEGEGTKGYRYREDYQHSCSHDILLVRAKKNPQLTWHKIRPRDTNLNVANYMLCNHFKSGMPCRIGEANCTFAHNQVEIDLWNLDRYRVFNIQAFIRDAAKEGIFSTEILEARSSKQKSNVAEPYIPGLQSIVSGNKRQGTPPPPQSPHHQAQQNAGLMNSHNNYVTTANFGGTAGLSSFSSPPSSVRQVMPQAPTFPAPQYHQQGFGAFPPVSLAQVHQQPPTSQFTNAQYQAKNVFSQPPPMAPPNFRHQAPPPIRQVSPPKASQPTFSSAVPNLSQPPPNVGRIKNPLPPEYKFQLGCPQCLVYAGKPWYYNYNPASHLCTQSILAYFVQDSSGCNFWVKVRERASHRNFKGFYVLCHSVRLGNIDMCKFKENCSFAHNNIEQRLWKLEQEGSFDIGEFILQNKKGASPSEPSSVIMYVKFILEKFGGYFRFICRDCFFASKPMISSQGEGSTCSGAARHAWAQSKIIAHVKNTSFTPIDQPKFVHDKAFYLMCKDMQYCQHWLRNNCKFAHSLIEKVVWMLERDTKISREELVSLSAQIFQNIQSQPNNNTTANLSPQGGKSWQPPSQAVLTAEAVSQAEAYVPSPSINLAEFCRTCWGKGQKSAEDGNKDRCVRGHNNFKVNSVFVSQPSSKEIRSLPQELPLGMKLILCEFHPKCTRRVCNHPHGKEELDVWAWMMKNKIKTLREMCDISKEMQKNKTRKINTGESVVSTGGLSETLSRPVQAKPLNQIIAPGDLVINELYCSCCGISCANAKQWDEHCMSEKHVNNVNSDKEHQWNYRQPPWGQGNNLALCAKHLHNQSCQYSYVPDMYNLCKYAHSQEELDEWRERHEWRQMKRMVARERNMFSYTEALLQQYYEEHNSVKVIAEILPGVQVECAEDLSLYKNEKNAIFTWTFRIYAEKSLEKVALLYNRERLHFSLIGSDNSHYQVATGDIFLDTDSRGQACYKVNVHFTGGMFGSFSQWVVFDFGSRPVLVKKLAVEIGDHLQHEKVRELREDLAFDRWTSLNREIVRTVDLTLDKVTQQLLHKYKEPSSSEDVVNLDSMAELNQHNYVHKMHKLLELEEITRSRIIASYNLITDVTCSQTLNEMGDFIIARNGDLFVKVNLSENLSEDTLAGNLVIYHVKTVLLAPVNSKSSRVYEANIVDDNNYGYKGRGKEYIYLIISASTASDLGLANGTKIKLELQFQMDRKLFCRMHFALDSLQTTDVLFPDVVKFRPDMNQVSSQLKIKSNVLNEDQMTAVRHIVVQRDGYTPPFIMYGPFGTGKTETLAQATMVLLRDRPNSRILICTQNNSAADLYITKHLSSFFKKSNRGLKMLRLMAPERNKDTASPEVLEYCYYPDGFHFEIPSKEVICQQNLVLITVENSLQLTLLGLYNHFTHIFIDEAGQSLECEVLMALTLASTKTCVVLTGDHQQIGPMVYSQEAKRQKFDMSLLVRLYNYYDYIANCGIKQVSERSQQSPLNIFLSINYRTKTEILRFISSVFYGGPDNLKAYGQIPSVMGLTPLMFYAVQGTEVQNSNSTSYLNHAEAQEIVERVSDLLENWPEEWGEMDPKKVGVIATYTDQIKHVRTLLRMDRRRPYLSQVDVGRITIFQGKEMRALFITTVRTTNLLQAPHIIQSLEAGEDIGDLGFLSNPKILNTALTRTQSYVAVIGDPVALCLIGECIQVWRTYLKHCTNMKSVRPLSYTYDMVKNQVVQILMSPQSHIVDMLAKRSQDSFKQSLRPRPSQSRSCQQDTDSYGGGDSKLSSLHQDEKPAAWKTLENANVSLPRVKSSIPVENRYLVKVTRQFSQDELSLSSTISCEDIIFQMATESLRTSEAGDNGFIKSERISIAELDNFAVLEYSQEDTRGKEPFKLSSDNEDFIVFVVPSDNPGSRGVVYENWSVKTMTSKLASEPHRYLKCNVYISGENATAMAIGPLPQHLSNSNQEIEIQGQLNRGHALHGDLVLVELLASSNNGKLQGQVKGILERAQDPSNRLYVCTIDPAQPGIVTPINSDVPRMFCLTSSAHIKLARKGKLCVYKFVSTSCIEFSHYENIGSTENQQLCIVRYLTWQPGFALPLGVVVGIFEPDDTLDQGMKILEVEHNIHQALRPQALEESERLFPEDSAVPAELLKNRQDLTQNYCFTISDPLTEDLEMAISVNQTDSHYEVGVHISDVVAYVDKDSILDQECEHRGASLFPMGREPKHMLPHQVSTDFCSLKPGFDRLAVSIIINVDESGNVIDTPNVFRSIINSKQKFTHAQVEDILLNPEDAQEDYLKSCIIVLYQLAYLWRCERLGNGHLNTDLEPEKRVVQHSYLMLNEVKLHINSIVAELLLSRFSKTTPLLVQPNPQKEKLEEWKKNNASQAFNSIPLSRAFLNDQVCQCKKACTCVFSYIRQNQLKPKDLLSMLSDSWLLIAQAVSEDFLDYELAQDLISNPDNMPHLATASHKLQSIQQPERYVCSGDVDSDEYKHYKLCVGAYNNCTNPLRRFISLVVQRMLVAYMDGTPSPYGTEEIRDVCMKATSTEQMVTKFYQSVFLIHLGNALKARPLALNAVVEEVDKEKATISFSGIGGIPRSQRTILLSTLSPAKVKTRDESPDSIQLLWEERVYDTKAQESRIQYTAEISLESDRFVCNIPTVLWQRLLAAVREKDEPDMTRYVQEISKQIGGEMELLSKGKTEVLSDVGRDGQVRHYVPFTFKLHESQILRIQISVGQYQGLVTPGLQLLNLTPSLDLCLEHKTDPVSCFTYPDLASRAKVTYTDEAKFSSEWLLPVLALESAHQAVKEGDKLTIHNVSIKWKPEHNLKLSKDIMRGEFTLSQRFCSTSNFQPDLGNILANKLLDNQTLFQDPNFCLDYLCVRYSNVHVPSEPALDESVAVLVNNGQPITWVGHCQVTEVTSSPDGYLVKVSLVQSSMRFPDSLSNVAGEPVLCTVEWICKTPEQRIIDIAARSLQHASLFAKDIITGRRPANTIDPVPQETTPLKSRLSEDQETIIADSYKQPFSAVIGGPGTGKTLLAACLAHLLVGRNRTADTYRQNRYDGYTTQLMVCAPTEKSLDVITALLLAMDNNRKVHIVRVYSEEIEERDYPISLSPNPKLTTKSSLACAVMEDVALHHLIRKQKTPASVALLEQEMLLSMYGKQVAPTLQAALEQAQAQELKKAQIIVCTCVTSARPILRKSVNIKQIILDDAGMISEAESIVPLVMHKHVNQLILLGDLEMPRPFIHNKLARQLGLARSLLQRYTDRAHKLFLQFRNIPAMCSFPSSYFYGSLLATSPQAPRNPPAQTIPWPGDFPSVFLHVPGVESFAEGNNKSYRCEADIVNKHELQAVIALTVALIQHHRVKEASILVLTATQAQANLIRESVPGGVVVNTVLESIGQEREYVILSTVRSLPDSYIQYPPSREWTNTHLGQMADPRVINLAITRAKVAFFIYGNKELLRSCKPWNSLLVTYRQRKSLQLDSRNFLHSMQS